VLPDGSIEVNGMSANYVLDLPAAYDKTRAYPVLLAFRRSDTTTDAFRESLGLPSAVGADAIVVHPNCPNDASTWAVPGDLPLIDALLSKLASSYCIDQGRVFAVGLGQGALLVNAFACVRSDTLRGIAPLSAVLAPASGACVGQAAALLMQSSTEPATMTFGRANRDYWIERNGCDASAPLAVAPSPCVEYSGCDTGFPVRFCEYGSDLPSSTARAIWDFFSQF
jgi:poly(3-hydroxybutyrate) depolymerase